ncbi:hypothetical protein BO83DRAFT_92657 [Aspergillus eucalypticola CBS 122712]|uniref:Uncharacterized protein n=1 Tax=Aspergillus eucalypticola (strain CBS 122712 / IBT 29274) TaxID=1448314 RepID=A0A317V2T9_ASPEC|nr:uncharacterized protein BO83DRAFT_92657 [Aspergillus eucalypticola CBS 122712]PWY67671.1 hypothetical protein BO83DRAFT_92657 [Aspergillus eucalypticola CBS 122712]
MHTGQWFLFPFTFSFIPFLFLIFNFFFSFHTVFFPSPNCTPLPVLPTSFPFPIACRFPERSSPETHLVFSPFTFRFPLSIIIFRYCHLLFSVNVSRNLRPAKLST